LEEEKRKEEEWSDLKKFLLLKNQSRIKNTSVTPTHGKRILE
jgi:hypothetical protein